MRVCFSNASQRQGFGRGWWCEKDASAEERGRVRNEKAKRRGDGGGGRDGGRRKERESGERSGVASYVAR